MFVSTVGFILLFIKFDFGLLSLSQRIARVICVSSLILIMILNFIFRMPPACFQTTRYSVHLSMIRTDYQDLADGFATVSSDETQMGPNSETK